MSDLQQELNLPSNQVLALFNKAIRKLHGHLRAVKEAAVERQLPRPPPRATPSAAAQAGMNLVPKSFVAPFGVLRHGLNPPISNSTSHSARWCRLLQSDIQHSQ